jgi:hypothetical protein
MIRIYKNSLGITLLEILVSITISIPILASLIVCFSNQNKNYFNLHKKLSYFETLAALSKISEQTMQDLDSHPFPIYPRIQVAPYIYLYDNKTKLNKIAIKNSTIISSMRLNINSALKLENPVTKQGKVFFEACLVNKKSTLKLLELEHAYIVHHEFQTEVQTIFRRNSLRQGCYQLEITNTIGMFSTSVDYQKLLLASYMIPIEWIRTYYLSEDRILRLLQHRGDKIILNQPILNNCLNFKIRQKESLVNHLELTFKIYNPKFIKSFAIQHHVPRLDFENFMANI